MDPPARSIGNSDAIVDEAGRRYAFADHHCFACGRDNPIGMRLRIELGEGTASTEWVGGDDYVGWSDKLHGGIIATLLDEAQAPVQSWVLRGVVPSKYTGPTLAGKGGGDVAMEELVLSAQALEVEV